MPENFFRVDPDKVAIVKGGQTQGMLLEGYQSVPEGRVRFEGGGESATAEVVARHHKQVRDLEPRELAELGYQTVEEAALANKVRVDSNVTAVFWNKKNDGPQTFGDLDKLPPAPPADDDSKAATPPPGDPADPEPAVM